MPGALPRGQPLILLEDPAMFEHHRAPLLSREDFLRRQLRFAVLSAAIVLGALAAGTLGYHTIEDLPWLDAQLNAAMILSGMGPVDRMQTSAGKLFASAYALVSGVLFVTTVAVLFAPVIHRFFHRLHLELEERARLARAACRPLERALHHVRDCVLPRASAFDLHGDLYDPLARRYKSAPLSRGGSTRARRFESESRDASVRAKPASGRAGGARHAKFSCAHTAGRRARLSPRSACWHA